MAKKCSKIRKYFIISIFRVKLKAYHGRSWHQHAGLRNMIMFIIIVMNYSTMDIISTSGENDIFLHNESIISE